MEVPYNLHWDFILGRKPAANENQIPSLFPRNPHTYILYTTVSGSKSLDKKLFQAVKSGSFTCSC